MRFPQKLLWLVCLALASNLDGQAVAQQTTAEAQPTQPDLLRKIASLPPDRAGEECALYLANSDFLRDYPIRFGNRFSPTFASEAWRYCDYRLALHLAFREEFPGSADTFLANVHGWLDSFPERSPHLQDALLEFLYAAVADEAATQPAIAEICDRLYGYWETRLVDSPNLACKLRVSKCAFRAAEGDLVQALPMAEALLQERDWNAFAAEEPDTACNLALTYSRMLLHLGLEPEARVYNKLGRSWLAAYSSKMETAANASELFTDDYLDILWKVGAYREGLEEIGWGERVRDSALSPAIGDFLPFYRLRFTAGLLHEESPSEDWVRANQTAREQIQAYDDDPYLLANQYQGYEEEIAAHFQRLSSWDLALDLQLRGYPKEGLAKVRQSQLDAALLEDVQAGPLASGNHAIYLAAWARMLVEAGTADPELVRISEATRKAILDLIEVRRPLPPFEDGSDHAASSGLVALLESALLLDQAQTSKPPNPDRILALILESEILGTLAKRMQIPKVTLQEVREALLDTETGIMHFQPGSTRQRWFLIDQSRVSVFDITSPRVYAKAAQELFEGLTWAQEERDLSELGPALETVSKLCLPEELLRDLQVRGWKRIRVTGLANHLYLPVELLTLPGEKRHFGDVYRVSYLPSMTVGVALSRRPNEPPSGDASTIRSLVYLGAGSPAGNGTLRSRNSEPGQATVLSLSALQERTLFQPIAGRKHLRFREAAANVAAANDLLSTRTALAYFLAHGGNAANLVGTPGLLLAGAGEPSALWTHKSLPRKVQAAMVFLTACSVGDSWRRVGDDGGNHLTGALLANGATAVLSATMPIELEESLLFDHSILETLHQGKSFDDAVFAARAMHRDDASFPGRYLRHVYGLPDRTFLDSDGGQNPGSNASQGPLPWLIVLGALGFLGAWRWQLARRKRA